MNPKITIVDISAVDQFLSAVCRFVTSAKFSIGPVGCSVMATDENKTIRAFYTTTSLISDVPVEFSIGDVRKFHRCVLALVDEMPKRKKGETVVHPPIDGLSYNPASTTLEYSGKIKFSIATVDSRVIDKFIGRALKVDPVKCFGVVVTEERHKKLVGLSSINSSLTPKVYMYRGESGAIMAEINDMSAKVSDSISIELSPQDRSYGPWDKMLAVKLDEFRNWMLLPDCELSIHGVSAASGQQVSYAKTEMSKTYASGVVTSIMLIVSLQKV